MYSLLRLHGTGFHGKGGDQALPWHMKCDDGLPGNSAKTCKNGLGTFSVLMSKVEAIIFHGYLWLFIANLEST